MASRRYGHDRHRRRRYGAYGIRRIRPLYVLVSGFFVVYVVFLTHWRFEDVLNLEGFAPTEQFRNLRQVMKPVQDQRKEVLDVTIAALIEEQRQNEEHMRHLAVPEVLPTISPSTAAPVAPILATVEGSEKTREMYHVVKDEEIEVRAPEMPLEAVEEMNIMPEQAEANEVAADVKLMVDNGAIEEVTKQDDLEMVLPEFAERHEEIYGYVATIEFLEKYQYNPDESLFLFFVCSDEQFKANDWSDECVEGKKHVYDVFSKSPGRNRLVTVFAGSEKYWRYQNDFHNDQNMRVKGVPCIMKWEGRSGRTEGMLVQRSLYDEPFLRYLFKNTDQAEVLLDPEDVKNKQILTVKGYDNYVDAMIKYEQEENSVPTFLMMVSGRFHDNNRPWCPYCRFSELPVEYAFYMYAPKNARMIRVEVADSYSDWKDQNEFTRDENLQLKAVPLMFQLDPIPPATVNDTKSIKFTLHKIQYDELTPLRELFTSLA
ncbi:unnamed protein product [Peronospora belbahrii]|uniref:Thioredoxin domain-containing protein n=1 Tax=Peronospora belbahrii TaxID=622444 RepID=A0AAU9L5C8_9STRA|nr:unnamed protein product [Peronospora belbahrii]CAH0513206.1 unnamed protein product [Peronospora belbahrii]